MALFNSDTFTRALAFVLICVLFSCVLSTIMHYAREELLMLRPDLRSGLSDRRGNVISLDLFNFGLCNRSTNIHKCKRGERGGKVVKFRQG